MRKAPILAIAALLAGAGSPIPVAAAATQQAAPGPDSPPDGQGSYDDLVTLFAAFIEWKTPTAVNGVVDYSPATVEKANQPPRRSCPTIRHTLATSITHSGCASTSGPKSSAGKP